MVKLRDQPDFPEESLAANLGRDVGPQHLQRHISVVLDIVSEVDRGHPALTQLAVEAVAVGEGVAELFEGGGRHADARPLSPASARWRRGGGADPDRSWLGTSTGWPPVGETCS